MQLQRPSFSFAVATAFSMLWTVGANAGAVPLYDYMPVRESVAEQATQYLQLAGPFRMVSRGPIFRYSRTRYATGRSDETTGTPAHSDAELESMPLDTPQQLNDAQGLALNLEERRQFMSANKLYQRILKRRQDQGTVDIKLAQILESTARTEILSGTGVTIKDSQARRDYSQTAPYYGYGYGPGFGVMGRSVIHDAISKDGYNLGNNLIAAEELYSRAVAIHRQLKDSDHNLVSDLLFLGALKDRQDKIDAAKAFYLEALERDHHASAYVASFCLKHKDFDFGKQVEPKLVSAARQTRDSAPISALLSMYLANKRSEDALRLFRAAMSTDAKSSVASLVLPVDLLVTMFDLISPDEVDGVTKYLISFPVRASLLSDGLARLMQALEQHGWGDNADLIRQFIVSNGMAGASAPRLVVVADSYVQSKKYALAISTYEQLATAVENEHESDERALKHLSALITAISSAEMKQQPECQTLFSKVSGLISFHQNKIRQNQSLETIDELNHKAFGHERNDEFELAQKLYQQALQMRQLNLPADDPETATQLLDVARTAGEQKHYAEAQSLYERVLSALRKNPHTDPAETIVALECYGQMLNEMKQEAKASKIYDEARDLSRKTQR